MASRDMIISLVLDIGDKKVHPEAGSDAGKVTVRLEPGRYEAIWFNAFTGQKLALAPVNGPSWTSPAAPSHNDWALLLLKATGKKK